MSLPLPPVDFPDKEQLSQYDPDPRAVNAQDINALKEVVNSIVELLNEGAIVSGFIPFEAAATKAQMSNSNVKRLIAITEDETNNGEYSLYFQTGSGLKQLQLF